MIDRALQDKPANATRWSTHSVSTVESISASTDSIWFRCFRGQPHLSRTFKLSTDPFCIAKVRNVAGLYLNLADHSMMLSADEKSKIQPLNHTQPKLPMDRLYVEDYTHN